MKKIKYLMVLITMLLIQISIAQPVQEFSKKVRFLDVPKYNIDTNLNIPIRSLQVDKYGNLVYTTYLSPADIVGAITLDAAVTAGNTVNGGKSIIFNYTTSGTNLVQFRTSVNRINFIGENNQFRITCTNIAGNVQYSYLQLTDNGLNFGGSGSGSVLGYTIFQSPTTGIGNIKAPRTPDGTPRILVTSVNNVIPDQYGNVATTPYKVYTALLTQSSTNNPVATILGNSLTTIISWTRIGTGAYRGTLTGEFTNNKTACFSSTSTNGDSYITFLRESANAVIIYTKNFLGVPIDSVLNGASFEVRVYP